MNASEEQKRKQALQALINIVILETVMIMAVIVIFVITKEISFLIFGVAGVALITGPLLWRWFRGHGQSMQPPADKGT